MKLIQYFRNLAWEEYEKKTPRAQSVYEISFTNEGYYDLFIKECLNCYVIPEYYLEKEFDESLISFEATNYFKSRGILFGYSEKLNSIKILYNDKVFGPTNQKDIVEYSLFDESSEVCSFKKGDTKSKREFIFNSFKSDSIALKLFVSSDNKKIVIQEFTLLKKAKRSGRDYNELVNFLKVIFNKIDSELIQYGKEQVSNISSEKTAFERLMELKKLYDAGIIDQATYEEKKKKFVDEL